MRKHAAMKNMKRLWLILPVLLFVVAVLRAASVNGWIDLPVISSPSSPGSGLLRIYANSGTLACTTSTGASCMPGTGFSINTGNILAYYNLNGLTNCNSDGSSVPDMSGFSNHNGTVVSAGGFTCDATGWYGWGPANYIQVPSSISSSIAAVEVLFDARGSSNTAFCPVFPNIILGSTGTAPQLFASYYNGAANMVLAWQTNVVTPASCSYGSIPPGMHHLTASLGGPANKDTFWFDGLREVIGGRYEVDSSGLSRSTTLKIGTDGSYGLLGKIAGILFKSAVPTDGEVQSDLQVMMAKYVNNAGPTQRAIAWPDNPAGDIFLVFGDSICAYFATTTWPHQWGGAVKLGNNAGGTILDPNSQLLLAVSQNCKSGAHIINGSDPYSLTRAMQGWRNQWGNFFVDLAGGTNDMNTTTDSGLQAWDQFVPLFLSQVRAAGGIPFVNTLIDRGGGFKTGIIAYNTRVRQECGYWDPSNKGANRCIVIDFASNALVGFDGANANSTYYIDATHPTQAGHNVMAAVAAPVVNSWWCTTRNAPSATVTASGTTNQGDLDCFVPVNPTTLVTATSVLPSAVGITNQIRRIYCLPGTLGTCQAGTAAGTILNLSGSQVSTVAIAAGTTAVFVAEYGTLDFPLNAAAGWRQLGDNW